MEDPCLTFPSSLERFLYQTSNSDKTGLSRNSYDNSVNSGSGSDISSNSSSSLSDLPILGTSALEQFLEQSVQENQRLNNMQDQRMSPDSSSNAVGASLSSVEDEQPPVASQNNMVPDSTTSDLAYDSDAFNSEDSCSSFAEVMANSAASAASEVNNANLLLVKDSSLNFKDLKNKLNHNNAGHHQNSSVNGVNHGRIKKKNVKKSKRAGDTLLKCEQCPYTTRFKEHLTSHMHTHATARNYMCSDCGQTFKWSHSLRRHQRTHAPSADFRYGIISMS